MNYRTNLCENECANSPGRLRVVPQIARPACAATLATIILSLAAASCFAHKPHSIAVLLPLHVCGSGAAANDARDVQQQRESARVAAVILAVRELAEVYDRDHLTRCGRLAQVARANDWKGGIHLQGRSPENDIEARSSASFGEFVVQSVSRVHGLRGEDHVSLDSREIHLVVHNASLAAARDAEHLPRVLALLSQAGLSGEFTDQDSGVSKFCLSCSAPASDQLVAAAAATDALIIDCTGTAFRPALINRIVTENGNSVLEPSKIAPEILARTGPGEYAKDIEQAKTLLAGRGAKHPLVVKATGVRRYTDAQLSEADATAVLWANEKSRFLEDAKVVFVCGKLTM